MRQLTISAREAGQRFDKFLKKYLNAAPPSFVYKMLRKKNIVLNGLKATGSELLQEGDEVALYFREETFEKFRREGVEASPEQSKSLREEKESQESQKSGHGGEQNVRKNDLQRLAVVYEDDDIVVVDKPAGILSQAASRGDRSVAEMLPELLLERGSVTKEDLRAFHPAPLNRLDRNTSGLVLCGKSIRGSQVLSELLKSRDLEKEYLAVTYGSPGEGEYRAYQLKDRNSNLVRVLHEPCEGAKEMRTGIRVIKRSGEFTLLGVHLITGRTHQIRAHLAYLGYPVLGDPKYGDAERNAELKKKFRVSRQMLHAWRIRFPASCEGCPQLSGIEIKAELPEDMASLIDLKT